MQICFFDIDGTLLNSGGAGQAAMEAALDREFNANKPVVGIPVAGRTDRAISWDLFEYYAIPPTDDNFERFIKTYSQLLPDFLAEREGVVLPGVPELLQALHQRDDVAVGLLTGNYYESAWLKLRHFDLAPYFSFGGYGDLHKDRDDVARSALEDARQRLNTEVHHSNCWVIGDTPGDVKCGRAIGAKVIAVDTGFCETDVLLQSNPDHFLSDLSETDRVLEIIFSRKG